MVTRLFIGYNDIVACGRCGWPSLFGSCYWGIAKEVALHNESLKPSRLIPLCFRCQLRTQGPMALAEPRIRESLPEE